MNVVTKAVALSTLALLATVAGHATEKAVPVATLNCTNPTLKANVYSYSFDTGQNTTRYFTVYMANSMFRTMEVQEYFGSGYAACTISTVASTTADNVTIEDVSSYGVGVDVDAGSLSEDAIGQQYTQVDFSYTFLSIGSASAVPKVPVTDEEKAKAASFAAYKARIASMPKP